jgi:uncharacterized membrane protein YoaK (UPF0700 family)
MVPPGSTPEKPLATLLLALTFGTGVIDAISFLGLDQVFVANMTGNVVLLGFALAGAQGLQVLGPILALLGFLTGAFAGGWLAERLKCRPRRWLAAALGGHMILVVASTLFVVLDPAAPTGAGQQVLILLLAVGMGLQTATARVIAVPDLNTAVITSTLTGLAADWHPGPAQPRPIRRILAVAALVSGAATGAIVLLNAGMVAALALTVVVLACATTGLALVVAPGKRGM